MLKLSGRVHRARGKQALSWFIGGGMAMGTGMWGMHFIVLLAYHLPIEITYKLGYTALSWGIAVLTSSFGLWLIKGEKLSRRRWLLGGIIMGCGMLAMHYVGMAAMEVINHIRYIPHLFAASIILAISGAIGMVWCAFYLRAGDTFMMHALRVGAALIMGLAMTVMHSVGAAAAHLSVTSLTLDNEGLDHTFLALTIASFTLITSSFALMLAYIDIRSRRHADALKATLKTAHSKLAYLGTHDVLTSLPNRLLLSEQITQTLMMIRRNVVSNVVNKAGDPQQEKQKQKEQNKVGNSFALLHISIDRLKIINETLGRDVGDQVLSAIVLRIRKGLTSKVTLARISGSEFVALLMIRQTNDAAIIAEKLINTVSAPLWIAPHEVEVTLSIGISVYLGDGDGSCTAEVLLGSADTAMEYVKQHGRNNYQFFTPEMQARHRDRVDLESGLRPALRNQEFLVYYQPKINFSNGKIASVEALLRWQHPEYGLVSPERFIPLAEESGLITSIGNWVLEAACQQSRAWQDAGLAPICIAVTPPPPQFLQRDLVEN
ncbi:MAG: diguanylate cyclase, partial [Glaciimonas sp.]|nr:diguanylate cyclase [Glaciimonas sp.]